VANGDQSALKGQVGVTYLPEGEGPNASHAACLGGWQLMLSAYSKHKDLAAKLIKYMVSHDTQKDHALKLGRLPTRPARSFLEFPLFLGRLPTPNSEEPQFLIN
jgi:trehalose/maltose transport system substrate-binding protein